MRRMLLLGLAAALILTGGKTVRAGCVTLTWTATGDDGWVGQASRYDIRYSRQFITPQNFPFANQYPFFSRPVPAGGRERVTICGLEPFEAYYFAIKIADEQGNWSAMSNVVLTASDDSTSGRGDVNLNTISYEAGDAVTFTNYLLYGPSAFLYDKAKQIAATDVNGDNLRLTVADLTYLVRIMVGDARPVGKLNPYARKLTVEQTVDDTSLIVRTESRETIGTAYFVFEAPPGLEVGTPTFGTAFDGMRIGSSFEGGVLKVLVYDFETDRISPGTHDLLSIPLKGAGELRLVSVDAADYDGQAYDIAGQLRVVPTDYELSANYPNPFNPSTHIAYTLPMDGPVVLKVYNSLGQLVRTLIDQVQPAGAHTIEWDGRTDAGATVASGIYFYRLQAADFDQTRKMLLLK